LVAPRLVPHVYAVAAERRESLTEVQRAVAAAVREHGACTQPQLRDLLGTDKKTVDGAVVVLQRALVLTNSHLVAQEQGWGAIAVDLVEPELQLAREVLASGGELSAADLGGALGWRQRRARETLDALVERAESG